jgi:hypothetical protein
MTALFVPFSEVRGTGSELLVEGSIPVAEAVSAAAVKAVTEMGLLSGVGELVRCRAIDGVLKVAARVWHKVAMSKVVERVYSGFALVCTPTADDELTVDRVALVDHPDALKKRLGGRHPMDLRVAKGVKIMSLPSKMDKRGGPAPDRLVEIMRPRDLTKGAAAERGRIQKSDHDALALIRAAQRQPAATGDEAFIKWWGGRQGR